MFCNPFYIIFNFYGLLIKEIFSLSQEQAVERRRREVNRSYMLVEDERSKILQADFVILKVNTQFSTTNHSGFLTFCARGNESNYKNFCHFNSLSSLLPLMYQFSFFYVGRQKEGWKRNLRALKTVWIMTRGVLYPPLILLFYLILLKYSYFSSINRILNLIIK